MEKKPFNFIICFNKDCSLADKCLRQLSAQESLDSNNILHIVNHTKFNEANCEHYLENKKVSVAYGMKTSFEDIDALSEEELKNITFSFQFKEKMARLVKSQKKPYYYMINTAAKRVACIIIAFVAVLTTLTFSVKALREPVVEFFLKTYRRFSIIFLSNSIV